MNQLIMFSDVRLTADPELKYTKKNTPFVSASVCYNERIHNKDGEVTEYTHFYPIELYAKTAENFAKVCRKGTRLFMRGEARENSWKDEETGKKRSRIVFRIDQFSVGGAIAAKSQPSQTDASDRDFNPSTDFGEDQPPF